MKPAAVLFALVASSTAFGQVSYGSLGSTYSQNFNTLATAPAGTTTAGIAWTNNTTLSGWNLYSQPAGGPLAITTYSAGDGSSKVDNFYSFGSGAATDRAFGAVGGSSAYFNNTPNGSVAGWMAIGLVNNTGSVLSQFTVGYDGEQWRLGQNGQQQSMALQYGFGSTFAGVVSWNLPGANFDFTGPQASGGAPSALDGNLAANRIANRGGTITGLNWANGATLWIAFATMNPNGNSHGLAIDNFSFISAVPEPGSAALCAGALAAAGLLRRRFRRIPAPQAA